MARTVVIDWLPERVHRYRDRVVVAIDVIRATTTVATAIAQGRRCFPVGSEQEAHALRARYARALLAGEQGGELPDGFDLGNSPGEIAARSDVDRPLVLLSTSGTKVVVGARGARRVYLACLRNISAQIAALVSTGEDVALIGAGAAAARASKTSSAARGSPTACSVTASSREPGTRTSSPRAGAALRSRRSPRDRAPSFCAAPARRRTSTSC
jgi:hypothetical protein